MRRVEIPKPDGGTRALGIAAIEDKIVQRAVCEQILDPIYESEFAGFGYGFRPGRSAHGAPDAPACAVAARSANWILEVDIEGYFDNIERERLVSFPAMRIGDRRVLRLVRKRFGAGVPDAGLHVDPARGTPQGAPISPLLADAYLHEVLDERFARERRPRRARGEAYPIRYADDFVLGFRYRADAVRFLADAKGRLAGHGLELHPDETRLVEFGRRAAYRCRLRGEGRPSTFDFLGLTHYRRTTRRGRFGPGRKPASGRMQRTLAAIKLALRRRLHDDPEQTAIWPGLVLGGWLGYFAVPARFKHLRRFRRALRRMRLRSLRRRSQRQRIARDRADAPSARFRPETRMLHPWPDARFAVDRLRQEPGALTRTPGSVRGEIGDGLPYREFSRR